jgi:hypothetical protein
MPAFSGIEPLVGEIVGLRTFRVDESGLLLPLYSNRAWYDGRNTALCAPPTGERGRDDHPVPSPDCQCGFYAYGSERAAARNRHTRYVQAIVSCWGGVVAGTQGVRAEHARVDAIWLHPNAPHWAQSRVAGRYPSARIYSDRRQMLTERPLSRLDCYEERAPRHLPARVGGAVGATALLGLGLLPASTLRGSALLWTAWLAAAATLAALVLWLLLSARDIGHRAAALITAGALAWVVAPLFGPPGWLLRAPLLRGLVAAAGGYLLSLRPGFFPIERSRRERAFCGVRT